MMNTPKRLRSVRSLSWVAAILTASTPLNAEPFYKTEYGLFSKRPQADKAVSHITRLGPIGMSIDLLQPAFTVRIKSIEPGSPAAATGALKPGNYIKTFNGKKLQDIDPRIQIGNLITEVEASDGKLVLEISDQPEGETREVTVQLEPLGTYSKTWPLNCPKSDKIVRNLAEYIKSAEGNQGFADIGMLFLLSTGDASDLDYVKTWAQTAKGPSSAPWYLGYGGLAFCEYYLRTGDKSVLPKIQTIANQLVEMENFGGWVGRGPIANLNYGGGGGHLNAAGVHCLTTLCMAKECGVDVSEESLNRVLTKFFRYSGRGNVPYGMGHPEGGFVDNGKNGKLAFAMAAAANLTGKGEESIYAKARDNSALTSFYSTSYMLHGHTGGGIGEIWRSGAMGLLHEKKPNHYREFMDQRRWHYELSRRFDGSFGIVGGERYDKESWGIAYALTYTIPRGHLRLTGAAQTKFSKNHALAVRPWGTAADDVFQSIQTAQPSNGKQYDISNETLLENASMAVNRRMRDQVSAEDLRKHLHHPNQAIRSVAAAAMDQQGVDFAKEMLASNDSRVRRAVLQGVRQHSSKLLTREVFDHLVKMLKDPAESWFVKDAVLETMEKAQPDWVAEQADVILPYLKHDEWWFRKTAMMALTPVVVHDKCYKEVIPAIGDMLQSNYRYNMHGFMRWGSMSKQIREASPEVQELARKSLKEAYTNFIAYDHKMDVVEEKVNPMNKEAILFSIAELPGGYDMIYAIGKEENPDVDLPYKQIFLSADSSKYSPELKKIVDGAVGSNLIPKYVAENKARLIKEAESVGEARGAKMPGLLELYNKVGINTYDWANYGPAPEEMKWYYHSFTPPEKWLKPDDRLGRYREVTYPEGMENWYESGFDPKSKGWKQGLAPFGAANGELERIASVASCKLSFCGCHKALNTLWENDVILINGDFEFPPFEEGYRYRLLHGGISHVGLGGGYRLYINGKLFTERKTGVDRRGGSKPIGNVINKEWWPEFSEGKVNLAAISFKKHHPKTKKYGGNLSIFMQRMKVPPIAGAEADSGEE